MEIDIPSEFRLLLLLLCLTNFVFCSILVYSFYRYNKLAKTPLKGKHVVVTGGSSGIGKSIACEAARRGANVTIIARNLIRLKAAKQEILQQCKNTSQMVYTVSLDVGSNYIEVEKAMNDVEKEVGPIFIMVNCAGTAVCGKLEDTPASEIKRILEINYLGSVYSTKAVIENMKSRGSGHIVFTSSQAGLIGIYGLAAYSATKFALRGFSEALYMEVKEHGVKVTVSFPPDTDTPGFAEEQKSKPKETKLISESSGLFAPDLVAKKMLDDTLAGVYMSSMGFEGFMLCILCAGMSPMTSLFNLFTQVFLMGPFRLVGAFYLAMFERIIKTCLQAKNNSKKAE